MIAMRRFRLYTFLAVCASNRWRKIDYVMYNGGHALCMYDDWTKQAAAYRQLDAPPAATLQVLLEC